jgi:hypothetical protein
MDMRRGYTNYISTGCDPLTKKGMEAFPVIVDRILEFGTVTAEIPQTFLPGNLVLVSQTVSHVV